MSHLIVCYNMLYLYSLPARSWQGLLDFPKKWWDEVQRIIFDDRKDSWKQITLRVHQLHLQTAPASLILSYVDSKDEITQDRVASILVNYKLGGTAYYLASIAKMWGCIFAKLNLTNVDLNWPFVLPSLPPLPLQAMPLLRWPVIRALKQLQEQ